MIEADVTFSTVRDPEGADGLTERFKLNTKYVLMSVISVWSDVNLSN